MEPFDQAMQAKICLITGATAGIGLVIARAHLAQRGASVVVVGRNPAKTAAVVKQLQEETRNPAIEFLLADLSCQLQIRELAQQFRERHPRLDVLINNAGGAWRRRQLTVDGVEMTIAVNHLAPFLLTHLLADRLVANTSPAAPPSQGGRKTVPPLAKGEVGEGLASSTFPPSPIASLLSIGTTSWRRKATLAIANTAAPS